MEELRQKGHDRIWDMLREGAKYHFQKRGGGGIGPKYRPLAKREFFCGGIVFGQIPTEPGFLFEEKLPF
jgi:hypothetical protein